MKLAAVREHTFSFYDLHWISEERDDRGEPLCLRHPSPRKQYFKKSGGFAAAGKSYPALMALLAVPVEPGKIWLDIYGRRVLRMNERYPCFDSSDYLYENRYYHYCYLVSDDRLTVVHYGDTGEEIRVTEDENSTKREWWPELKRLWGE